MLCCYKPKHSRILIKSQFFDKKNISLRQGFRQKTAWKVWDEIRVKQKVQTIKKYKNKRKPQKLYNCITMDILSLCWLSNTTWVMGYKPPYQHYFLFGNVAFNTIGFLVELTQWGYSSEGWNLFLCLNLLTLCVIELIALALIDHNIALGMREVTKNRASIKQLMRQFQTKKIIYSKWGFIIVLLTSSLLFAGLYQTSSWYGKIRAIFDPLAIIYLCLHTFIYLFLKVGHLFYGWMFPQRYLLSRKNVPA